LFGERGRAHPNPGQPDRKQKSVRATGHKQEYRRAGEGAPGRDVLVSSALRLERGATTGSDLQQLAGPIRSDVPRNGGGSLWDADARALRRLEAAGQQIPHRWPLLDGWGRAPGGGRSDGPSVGADGSPSDRARLPFDIPVARDGYAWWYADGVSHDGRFALTLIAFVGAVFSPHYKRARARAQGDPALHCGFNVALYRPGRKLAGRWAYTEYTRHHVTRSQDDLAMGPNRMSWRQGELRIRFDERTAPWGGRLQGHVAFKPLGPGLQPVTLAPGHAWFPAAPHAQFSARLSKPDVVFSGHGYVDANHGDRPLESSFNRWQWCRGRLGDTTHLQYDVETTDGRAVKRAWRVPSQGTAEPVAALEPTPLPVSRWGVKRWARQRPGAKPGQLVQALEDTPFYTRSLVQLDLEGSPRLAMHETLDLKRFSRPWVQFLLPYRMRRAV